MVMWWDVKRSLYFHCFLVLGTFTMLVGYGDVRFRSVAVEATLEKTPTAIRRGAITEQNSKHTQHAGKRAAENFEGNSLYIRPNKVINTVVH
ncbi:hypothetical protein NC653_003438 [Populus alba x Populus x berolinensis]|uniref:Uncharacterized protein n=1 Tax=Populus alba x Populus x berolinensis TaxID=444605 RepID=A0AAD6RSB6_9ROSI|nr:hypothetical protein NC653_003438 [Populus alba x Populus x berolinensis]